MNSAAPGTKTNRTRQAALGTATGSLHFAVVLGFQALLAPLVLETAGQETLGAYSVIIQAVAYLALVDLGFGVALNRHLAQSAAETEWRATFANVFAIGRTYGLVSNGALAGLLVLLALNLEWVIELSPPVAADARAALVLLALWSLIRTPLAIFGAGLTATQHQWAANVAATIGYTVRLGGAIALLLAGWGLVGMIMANVIGEAVTLGLQRMMFQRRYPTLRVGWGLRDRELVSQMLRFGGAALLLTLGARLTYSADSIIVGSLFGPAVAAIYYTTQMPAYIAFNLIYRPVASAEPAINELVARRETSRLRGAYLRLHRYTAAASVLAGVGFILLGKSFISLWVGADQYAGTLMGLALGIFIVMTTLGNIDYTYMLAEGKVGFLSRLMVTEGAVNVLVSIGLAKLIGFQGVMLATVIVLLPRIVYQSITVRRGMGIAAGELARTLLHPLLRPILLAVAGASGARAVIGTDSWQDLVLVSMVFGVLYGVGWLSWGATREEREAVKGALRKRIAFSCP